MDLKSRFYNALNPIVTKEEIIDAYWNTLSEQYKQSFRKYHNLNHLKELFAYFDGYRSELQKPEEVALAIFYHDAIYSIWSKKNEWHSAELASEHLESTTLTDAAISRIHNLILVTQNHQPNDNTDEKWMIDFDLAILGQDWESYTQYTQQIHSEYASVPGLIYKKGRRKVLQHFLDKERIFKTGTFIALYETQARKNLEQEIRTL